MEQVEKEKQYAIETKAWISDKKTATAMNTASHLSKKVTKLEIEVDRSKLYSTVRKQEIKHKAKFAWQPLKKYCNANGLDVRKVDDDLFENVNSYPAEAWFEVHGIEL